jgi:predicted metal-dependent phosphoesterase TrpH
VGVQILAITDHDTFAGYDQASAQARIAGLELVCGIELSTKLLGTSVHLLGYFFETNKLVEFRTWLEEIQNSRRQRNARLARRLRELGFDITLEEVEARGRGVTGRPHFAELMVEKRFVANVQQAFDKYLGELAEGYVHRKEPKFVEGVERIRKAGGIASLAHPVRVKANLIPALPELCEAGLNAIEAYHSDHSPVDTEFYLELAKRYGLLVTGGSDFHGASKPGIALGTGRDGNLKIPESLLEGLRG